MTITLQQKMVSKNIKPFDEFHIGQSKQDWMFLKITTAVRQSSLETFRHSSQTSGRFVDGGGGDGGMPIRSSHTGCISSKYICVSCHMQQPINFQYNFASSSRCCHLNGRSADLCESYPEAGPCTGLCSRDMHLDVSLSSPRTRVGTHVGQLPPAEPQCNKHCSVIHRGRYTIKSGIKEVTAHTGAERR